MSIVDNRKAFHDYFIEERYEAGIVLSGWEVKAIRAGQAHIKEAHIYVKNSELFLLGSHITPLATSGNLDQHWHQISATQTRKLLLHKAEIEKLAGKVARAGYTLVPLDFHYTAGRIKCEIGLAKGKKQHDKRDADRERDAKREVEKAMKQNSR